MPKTAKRRAAEKNDELAPPQAFLEPRTKLGTPNYIKIWLRVVPQVTLNRAAAQCPLWVKSRHLALKSRCPLCPRKRTFLSAVTQCGALTDYDRLDKNDILPVQDLRRALESGREMTVECNGPIAIQRHLIRRRTKLRQCYTAPDAVNYIEHARATA